MNQFLSRFHPGQLEGFVILGAVLITGLIIFLTWQWRIHRRTEMEFSLKQDMINRGMSAEDIERVLTASMAGCRAKGSRLQDSSYAAPTRQ
jgi:hypothetical protein